MTVLTHAAHAHASSTPSQAQAVKKTKKLEPVTIIGRIASVLSVIMYVSYVTQIANNLAGSYGSPWQPLAAFFNCMMWTAYGFMKPQKDWPIIVANIPGIFLGFAAFITALVH